MSIHPQVYKEGPFSLDPQWFHRSFEWGEDDFQPQRYSFADLRSTTKVERSRKRAGVSATLLNVELQSVSKPWHDDSIFVMCPHKILQQVAKKAIWEED